MWKAVAFVLHILLQCAGVICQETINGCDLKPCQNGGSCKSHQESYICQCSQERKNGLLYGGENCSVALVGCQDHRCLNGGTCSPYLMYSHHRYTCACPQGFAGPKCQTPTTFSFETNGYLLIESSLANAKAPLNVTLSFQTDHGAGTILQHKIEEHVIVLELVHGRLHYTMQRVQSNQILQGLVVEEVLADGQWHRLEATVMAGVLGLHLSCTEGDCQRETVMLASSAAPTETPTEPSAPELGSGFPDQTVLRHSLFIGGVEDGAAVHFIGCMRDVYLDSQLVVPGVGANAPAEQVNVTMGCSDHDSCEDTPCQSRGRCISQGWRGYTCECHRPYEGAECQEEYITAHFGKEDSESYAVFSADEGLSQSIIMSLFIRTRHTHGLLLVMANSTSQYLHIWIHDGKVKLQINNSDILVSRGVVNDGHFHLVTVKVDEGMVEMILSAQNQGNIPIQSVCMQPGDLVYVGGLPDHRATAAYGGYFKGCIQDLRVNSKRLQFYPLGSPVMSYSLERLVKVTRGCAGDNSCSTNPCLNGGVCYSIWDDFTCKCPPNVTGRRCEQVKWCELLPCPPNAVCQSQAQGFQCVSNVTLQENSPIITFKSNGKIQRQLSSITMQFRTSASDATLLHAETASDFITISIQDFYMVLELQAGEASPKLSSESQVPVSDGQWHTLHLSMQDPTLQASEWTMILDGDQEKLVTSTTASGDLNFLKEGVDILVGGLGTEVGGDLVGCLGLVEIGGLLLPFYNDSETNLPRPQEERFIRTSGPPQYGCLGSDVCESEPCEHGGVCIDLFDRFNCNCPAGWRGSRCEETADVCASKPCVHGNCILLSEGYECVCDPEYEGKHCQMQADACARNECGQGATCLRGFARYACLCPQNTTGPFCTEKIPEIPWYIDRIPYPKLPVSVCGTERLNYSCFNGGNCSLAEDGCDCMPGFTGHWCELEVDECASDPCLNGGFCRNLVNKFQCVCEMSFSGEHCQIDVSDFYAYVFLLLWQNIFQLLSYLIIRLDDDDPEIDWVAHDY